MRLGAQQLLTQLDPHATMSQLLLVVAHVVVTVASLPPLAVMEIRNLRIAQASHIQ
jgi:hypothetical protein